MIRERSPHRMRCILTQDSCSKVTCKWKLLRSSLPEVMVRMCYAAKRETQGFKVLGRLSISSKKCRMSEKGGCWRRVSGSNLQQLTNWRIIFNVSVRDTFYNHPFKSLAGYKIHCWTNFKRKKVDSRMLQLWRKQIHETGIWKVMKVYDVKWLKQSLFVMFCFILIY